MGIKKIHYKDDFELTLKAIDGRGQYLPIADGWDFVVTVTTSRLGAKYKAARHGGVCTCCHVEPDGSLHVMVDNHNLIPGKVSVEVNFDIPQSLYPDGAQRISVKCEDVVELVYDKGDLPADAEIDLRLPAIKGDKGDKMVYSDLTDDDIASLQQGVADRLSDKLAKTSGIYEFGTLETMDNASNIGTVVESSLRDQVLEIVTQIRAKRHPHGTIIANGRKYQLFNYDYHDTVTYDGEFELKLYCFWIEPTNDNLRIDTAKVVFKCLTGYKFVRQMATVNRRIDLPLTANIRIDLQALFDRVNSAIKDDGTWLGLRVVNQTDASVTIDPNVLNVWGEVSELSIDFAPSKDGYAGEYCIEFISGETPTVLSLPASVKFPDDPEIEANMRYQVSVVNNVGLIAGVEYVA